LKTRTGAPGKNLERPNRSLFSEIPSPVLASRRRRRLARNTAGEGASNAAEEAEDMAIPSIFSIGLALLTVVSGPGFCLSSSRTCIE
jgi:hypothetical protein